MSDKKCPRCGLWNTNSAINCDCGYDFGIVKEILINGSKPPSPQPSQQLQGHKKSPKAMISIVASSVGIIFAMTEFAIGTIILGQARNPANNAMVMPKVEWERFSKNMEQLVQLFFLAVIIGVSASIVGFIIGKNAGGNIRRSVGRLGGEGATSLGQALGFIGAIIAVLPLCLAVFLFFWAVASI
jgi:hypothetical protein